MRERDLGSHAFLQGMVIRGYFKNFRVRSKRIQGWTSGFEISKGWLCSTTSFGVCNKDGNSGGFWGILGLKRDGFKEGWV